MNSLQSAGDGSVDLSRGPSLSGDLPGLRLGLDDGVRGSLYRDLRKGEDSHFMSESAGNAAGGESASWTPRVRLTFQVFTFLYYILNSDATMGNLTTDIKKVLIDLISVTACK